MDLFSDDQMVALLPHGDLPGQGSNSDGASCSVSGHGFQPAVLLSPPQQKSSQAGPLLQQGKRVTWAATQIRRLALLAVTNPLADPPVLAPLGPLQCSISV